MSTPIVPSTQCKICDREFNTLQGLSTHITRAHTINVLEYYYTYINSDDCKCLTCGTTTELISIAKGYRKFCSIKCNNRNPELAAQRIANGATTHKRDPSIRRNAGIKYKQTNKENPNIKIDAVKKMKHTRSLNSPEVRAAISKKVSIGLREYYSNLSCNSSSAECSIYIIAHCSLDIVKIGITTDFNRRLSCIQRDYGPIRIAKNIETTHDIASALEIKMHNHFKEYCKVQPSGSGRTEWFDACITDEALLMLTD